MVWVGLLGLAVLLIMRLMSLQVLESDRGQDFLRQQGDRRAIRTEKIVAHRGMIADRNGEPLAISTPVVSVWANPTILSQHLERNGELAKQLGINAGKLRSKIQRVAKRKFIYLKRRLTPPAADKVRALKIPGVYFQQEYKRYYPAAEVAAHIVGFTNIDDRGQEGLELTYDRYLKGIPGKKRILKDLHGNLIRELDQIEQAKSGKDLYLSIDLRIQYIAYKALKKAIKLHHASSGSVVVLDSRSGEVLAAANQPSFNPNNRRHLDPAALRNRVITDVFEPGSTVKPLTMIAALESGEYTPQTMIDTNPGSIKVDRKVLLDPVNYGNISLTKVIKKSSQVGTTKVALSLEPEVVRNAFYRAGLGQATGTGFPGEGVGVLPNRRRWSDIERATFAFGYGLSVTPLQLAQSYTVFANHGYKKPVSLVRREAPPEFTEQVTSAKIADEILAMMATVTERGGTGTRAAIKGYNVAGKSGTAHKADRGGYSENEYTAIFAGIAPVDDPRLIIVVVVNDPKAGQHYGGQVSAPVFAEVAAATLAAMGAPPDRLQDFEAPAKIAGSKH
ncbi:cell division protein FtsI (penicillin-binding protein 3) [Sinobacterium caligoides]|uniref:Peptidoglycan D,D-transpeptidase FtsI n=1 Tax=Sinobacterium caligoides TaxID=933926 RepID=A0A3N2D4R4_9GAMM|nr:cell division protein FtsI (penicillin-binding protein 3) [Sinobacterium caligoides]